MTSAGSVVTCASCAHIERPYEDEDGVCFGRCTFHDMTFETRKQAIETGCTFWQRKRRRK
jgi:hypothetical protein